jgi:hypothetical protein
MSKHFFGAAFALGLAALGWVGWGFVGTSWLALLMTATIAGVYLLGAFELRHYRSATGALARAVADVPQPLASLASWLDTVPAALRDGVRLRIEGERAGLPGPALTPYLVGLLVMLGMLGTFLGMVVTFKGAVFALEGSTDVQAIRAALAAPIRGLGLAFGTSVAGVAASAMLGLMSAIARRERQEVVRRLDQRIGTALLPFSHVHQRQETFKALQLQARALPEVVDKLDAMMLRIEERSRALDDQLLARHAQLQRDVTQACTEMAASVGDSLQASLAAGARSAGETIAPLVASAMSEVVAESRRVHAQQDDASRRLHAQLEQAARGLHAQLGELTREQVDALSGRFAAIAETVSQGWTAALERHAQTSDRLAGALQGTLASFADTFDRRSTALVAAVQDGQARQQAEQATLDQQRLLAWTAALQDMADRTAADAGRTVDGAARLLATSEELVRARTEAEDRWTRAHGERMDQLAGLWRSELAALRQEEGQRGQAAVERLGELQGAVTQHLATLGAALEGPLSRLLQTAAEVPQAAAGVIAQLRHEMADISQRENLALQERTVLLEQLGALLQSVNQASGEQRHAVESLVGAASAVLAQGTERFAQVLDAQAGKAAETSAHVAGSAIELASLAQAFGEGVQAFQATNDKLVDSLQKIDASLNRSVTRSDEQLAYYVAQAREVIDLSIASQEGLVENLRQLRVKPIAVLPGARA